MQKQQQHHQQVFQIGETAINRIYIETEPVKKDKPVVLDKIQLSYRNAPKKAGIQDHKEEDLELTRVPLVQWHYLTPKEIFVDRKTLRRIAEDGTVGKVLIDLKEFFTKKRFTHKKA